MRANGHLDDESEADWLHSPAVMAAVEEHERVAALENRVIRLERLLDHALAVGERLVAEFTDAHAVMALLRHVRREPVPSVVDTPPVQQPSPPPPAEPPPAVEAERTDVLMGDEWHGPVQSFLVDGVWDEELLGPAPGEPNCRVPREVLDVYPAFQAPAEEPAPACVAEEIAPAAPVEQESAAPDGGPDAA